MENQTDPTSKLCRWACTTQYEDIPAEVRKEAVTLLYDQIGGMIASATLPSCQPVVDLVRKLGPAGECSVVGHSLRTSVTNAVLANGTIGHGTELDSTGQQGTGHLGATAVPTALSVGQYVGATGKELVRALALGAEATARCQSVLGHGTRDAFTASVGATMGVAVNAGLLLRLDAEQMEHALGLAASGACGLASEHVEKLHQIKSLNFGKAAEAGVLAALLAQGGFRAPKEILTIEHGFFDAFLGRPEAGHEVVESLGENYLMRQIAYQRYCVPGPDQAPLYAFLQFIKKNKLAADDIEQIDVSVSRGAFNAATTNQHASVRMENLLCMAAVYGDVTFSHVHDPRYCADPRVKTFRERVRIVITPRAGPATMAQRMDMGMAVRIRTGETLRQELRYPLMTEAEIQQKFRSLAGLRLSSDRIADLERKLLSIEGEKNVVALIRGLEMPNSVEPATA